MKPATMIMTALVSMAMLSSCAQAGEPWATAPSSGVPSSDAPSSIPPSSDAPSSTAPSPSTPSQTTPVATVTKAPPTKTNPARQGGTVLGPTGLGALKLGMTKEQARATNLVEHVVGNRGTCADNSPNDGWLKAAGKPKDGEVAGRLVFSARTNRLIAIYAYPGVTTVEGIRLGSSLSRVQAVYPSWTSEDGTDGGRDQVKVPGNPNAWYSIQILASTATIIDLEAKVQDCWG